MKKKKETIKMDERSKNIACRIIAIMYFLTILAMQGIMIYRQFALRQDIHDFEDIAIIVTVNSLFLVAALLYFGAISVQRLKVKSILSVYLILLIVGFLFTWAKYNLFEKAGLDFGQLMEKLGIIAAILGIIVATWIGLSILGKKRLEKELED